MSSTTDRHQDRGQILVMFAGGLFTLIVVAAMAFDTGMMLLERRDQQNAADAAALAGARYLIGTPAQDPHVAARAVATANGFTDGVDDATVEVHIPPANGRFTNNEGFIEVEIQSTRPSIFAWVLGIFGWDVSARAVAANQQGVALPYSMLSLHPDWCSAFFVSGDGDVQSNGSIQVNSTCDPALRTSGQGARTVTLENAFCNSAGGITSSNNAELNCNPAEADSYSVDDPLLGLPAPPTPALAASVISLSGEVIPNGCPGSSVPATAASPALCRLAGGGEVWRIFPGYYPGGLEITGSSNPAIVYMEPGIYYIGGGGFRVAGAQVMSVDAGTTTYGGGVLIYNSIDAFYLDECSQTPIVPPVYSTITATNPDGLPTLPNASYPDGTIVYDLVNDTSPNAQSRQLWRNNAGTWENLNDLVRVNGAATPVASSPTSPPWPSWPCMGPIILNGSSAPVNLLPLADGSDWDGMVIFVDRAFSFGEHYWCGTVPASYPTPVPCETITDVQINGSSSDMEIRGTVYVPWGHMTVNGNEGELTMDQLIASTLKINGNSGTLNILYEMAAFSRIRGVGLVE